MFFWNRDGSNENGIRGQRECEGRIFGEVGIVFFILLLYFIFWVVGFIFIFLLRKQVLRGRYLAKIRFEFYFFSILSLGFLLLYVVCSGFKVGFVGRRLRGRDVRGSVYLVFLDEEDQRNVRFSVQGDRVCGEVTREARKIGRVFLFLGFGIFVGVQEVEQFYWFDVFLWLQVFNV